MNVRNVDIWIREQMTQFPEASEKPLRFIAKFRYMQPAVAATQALIMQFTHGYCYYFALMLQNTFGGFLFLVRSKSHIVWSPDGKFFYDINGVYNGKCPKSDLELLDTQKARKYMHC